MSFEPVLPEQKADYNAVVTHPLQSYEWGEFREKTGIKVIRRGVTEKGKLVDGFQLTIHPVPRTNRTIGYLPKGNLPTKEVLAELEKIGLEENCIFIQLEPNVVRLPNTKYSLSCCSSFIYKIYLYYGSDEIRRRYSKEYAPENAI